MIAYNLKDIVEVLFGDVNISEVYIGVNKVFPSSGPVPPTPYSGFCRLTRTDGTVNEIEGSGELTVEKIGEAKFGTVIVEVGTKCTGLGEQVFAGYESLTTATIPDTVTSIPYFAFHNCTKLTNLTIPNNITSIGEGAFEGCTSLASFTIPDTVTSIGATAFGGCTGITDIIIPDSVTSIGDKAFDGCTGLTSITIPDSVTSIGTAVFWRCSNLTSVTLNSDSIVSKNYTESSKIGDIFGSQVTEYIIGSGVTSIGDYAFYLCTKLISFTIPDTVTSIGASTFANCVNLSSITSLATTAPTIQSNTFYNVKTRGTLTVPSDSSGYDVWMGTGDYYLGKRSWTKVEQ